MAAEPLSTTRRALLGAAASLPVLSAVALREGGSPTGPIIASGAAARQSSTADLSAEASREGRWTRRLARYRRLHARCRAEAESGAFRAANESYKRTHGELAARFGSWAAALESREGPPLCDAAFERLDAAEDAYYDRFTAPTQRAAELLALTPAPNLEALATKIQIMDEHRLDEPDSLDRPALEVLAEDVGRLAAH